jgi:hypothetical protein
VRAPRSNDSRAKLSELSARRCREASIEDETVGAALVAAATAKRTFMGSHPHEVTICLRSDESRRGDPRADAYDSCHLFDYCDEAAEHFKAVKRRDRCVAAIHECLRRRLLLQPDWHSAGMSGLI